MKRLLSVILAVVLMATMIPAFALPAFAATIVEETDDYTLDSDGVMTFKDGVTEIDGHYIENWRDIKSVLIPNSVTNIFYGAFIGYKNIAKIEVDSKNEYYTSIDGVLYDKDVTELICCPAGKTSMSIPDSVTKIGYYSCNNSALTEITIPKSVNEIMIASSIFMDLNTTPFSDCPNLIAINVDADNKEYASFDGALYNKDLTELIQCPNGAKDIDFSNEITTICDSAFSSCANLTSVTIPNSVTEIGASAFLGCENLTSVTVPNGITEIASDTFDGCTSLTSITIPNSVTVIGLRAFADCESLTSITIPNSVTSIWNSAFQGCENLKSVTMSKSVEEIDNWTFGECPSLKDIYYYGSKTDWDNIDISDQVFDDLSSLTIHYDCVDSSFSGIRKLSDGKYWYYKDGVKQTSTGMIKMPSTSEVDAEKYVYIKNGVKQTSYTGLVKYDDKYWYVSNGVYQSSKTGMVKMPSGSDYNAGKYVYIKKGKKVTSYTGLVKYNKKYWYVKKGVYQSSKTGMVKMPSGSNYNAKKYVYVKKGKKATSYTGLVKYSKKYWYVSKGVFQSSKTGIFKMPSKSTYNPKKSVYIKKGYKQVKYTGSVTYSGKTYRVTKGVVK